jgi:hypothetical protein
VLLCWTLTCSQLLLLPVMKTSKFTTFCEHHGHLNFRSLICEKKRNCLEW